MSLSFAVVMREQIVTLVLAAERDRADIAFDGVGASSMRPSSRPKRTCWGAAGVRTAAAR